MTFNTFSFSRTNCNVKVLNLVINGWPSIRDSAKSIEQPEPEVLNLVINGWPSIHSMWKLRGTYW